MGLIQGKSTVAEYAHTFDRLACFAPELVPTDQARRDKFIDGLNGMIARDAGITLSWPRLLMRRWLRGLFRLRKRRSGLLDNSR